MDTVTHIALGAVIGEAMLGKAVGKRALLLGSAAQVLPDIDVIAASWLSPAENLLAHRGFTHSLLFVFIASAFLGLAAERWHRSKLVTEKKWVLFFALQLLIHILIDASNAYGVGWFEPFSHHRFAFNLLFVADPFFSASLGISALALIVTKLTNPFRLHWVKISLVISTIYIVYAIFNQHLISRSVDQALHEKNINAKNLIVTPTPLNNWLWFIAAEADSGFYVGYRSVFDKKKEMDFHYFPQNKNALDSIHDHEALQHLLRFSQGFYTVESRNDTLLFNDLRFGQITGWVTPDAKFSFHFYLEHPDDNTLVIQRGRFANWNTETIVKLFERIRGKE